MSSAKTAIVWVGRAIGGGKIRVRESGVATRSPAISVMAYISGRRASVAVYRRDELNGGARLKTRAS